MATPSIYEIEGLCMASVGILFNFTVGSGLAALSSLRATGKRQGNVQDSGRDVQSVSEKYVVHSYPQILFFSKILNYGICVNMQNILATMDTLPCCCFRILHTCNFRELEPK